MGDLQMVASFFNLEGDCASGLIVRRVQILPQARETRDFCGRVSISEFTLLRKSFHAWLVGVFQNKLQERIC